MRIIRERQRHHETIHRLCFSYSDGCDVSVVISTPENDYEYEFMGFSFPCDENGNILLQEMSQAALANYHICLSGKLTSPDGTVHTIRGPVHEETEHNWSEPAIGECECGEEVSLGHFTNTCENCHRDYNSRGQELCDRQFWSEDTGESLSDILRIP